MNSPSIGCTVQIDCQGLAALIEAIRRRGFQVVGPTLRDAAIAYGPITSLEDLPAGWTADQEPGAYRLRRRADDALFGYAAGPNSLKTFLHPPEIDLWRAQREDGAFRILPQGGPAPQFAFLGVRPCELAAMAIQDRVLTGGTYRDPVYAARRVPAVVVAVQCSEPAATCFCASLGTGPRAADGFDLALTEMLDASRHEFALEIGSELGRELLAEIPYAELSPELRARAGQQEEAAAGRLRRTLETGGLADLLREQFDHPHWDDIASRCYACGNCTQVCPTCFCVNVEDSSDVTGTQAARRRTWDSCFSVNFSYIHGGGVRVSTKARYRQWLTHKFSYWKNQFGESGCVGCGRCIAWCPAGIDLTREIETLRAQTAAAPERGAS